MFTIDSFIRHRFVKCRVADTDTVSYLADNTKRIAYRENRQILRRESTTASAIDKIGSLSADKKLSKVNGRS